MTDGLGQGQQSAQNPLPILVTISEAARLMAVSTRTIYRLIDRGDLSYYKVVGDAPRIRRSDLDTFLEGCRVLASTEDFSAARAQRA